MSGALPRERHSGPHDRRKRRPGAPSSTAGDESETGIELEDLREKCRMQDEELRALHTPMKSKAQGIFNMQTAGDREKMEVDIWTADFSTCMESLKTENPELVAVLVAQMSNQTRTSEVSVAHKQLQLDGVLLNIVRGTSMHNVPLLTVALSLMCEMNMVKREFHDAIVFLMKGALLSESWVAQFMEDASKVRPTPNEPMIPGVMVTVFDNLTMNVGYHSYSVGGTTGEKLDMTNWFAVRIPRSLAPTVDGILSSARHSAACCLERVRLCCARAPVLIHVLACCRSARNLPKQHVARRLLPAILFGQRRDRGQQEGALVQFLACSSQWSLARATQCRTIVAASKVVPASDAGSLAVRVCGCRT